MKKLRRILEILLPAYFRAPVSIEVKRNHFVTIVGSPYHFAEMEGQGFYGGMVSLADMKPGDEVEVSFYLYVSLPDKKRVSRHRYQHQIFNGPQEDPVVTFGPVFSSLGASAVLTQRAGLPRLFNFEFYRIR